MILAPRGLARWQLTEHTSVGSYASRWWAFGQELSKTPAKHMLGAQTRQGHGKIMVFFKEYVNLNKSLMRKGRIL